MRFTSISKKIVKKENEITEHKEAILAAKKTKGSLIKEALLAAKTVEEVIWVFRHANEKSNEEVLAMTKAVMMLGVTEKDLPPLIAIINLDFQLNRKLDHAVADHLEEKVQLILAEVTDLELLDTAYSDLRWGENCLVKDRYLEIMRSCENLEALNALKDRYSHLKIWDDWEYNRIESVLEKD